MTLKRAEEYRRLAQECRATARTLSSEEARNDMLAQADVWDRLADQQNYGTDLSEGTRPAPKQPAAQQQQQIQPADDDNKEKPEG
jgi:hypothetical protein